MLRVANSFLACLVIAPAACNNSTSPEPQNLPATIRECETNTARVCGIWTRVEGTNTYSAVWTNGSKAVITAVQIDEKAVVLRRTDTAGPTMDMIARYVAIPDGRLVQKGQVRWTTGGQTFFGTWDADW